MENNTDRTNDDGAVDSGASLPEVSFDTLTDTLRQACERMGWTDIMPVQKRAIPYVLAGRDVMVQARTGSGKTGAFVLPLLQHLDVNANHCQALVLVPTRELARQVAQEARDLSGPDGIRVVEVYGGVAYGPQKDAFNKGAQLVVGTPGRILDHLQKGNLTLDKLQILIFDEADRMLSVGFYPDMKQVQRYLPEKLFGAFMFSATFPHTVLRLADEFLTDPEMLSLSGDQVHVADIEHVVCQVPAMGKERVLIRWIEMENPTSAIIFCNTKRNVEFIAAVLRNFGYDAHELSSDLTQNKREKVLARIREGKLRFLVATDVAARGIDIHELSHVFLLEPPEDPESYIHRAGRTGRAGASGTVITLVDVIQKAEMNRIAHRFSIEFLHRDAPTDKDVAEVVEGRLTVILEARKRALSEDHLKRLEGYVPLARAWHGDVAALMTPAMLLDEVYQASLSDNPDTAPQVPEGEPKELDPERLAAILEDKRGKLKPIQRERVSRYLRLAGELTGDDEACVLLAMLMDAVYQSAGEPAPRRAEAKQTESGDQPVAEKKRKRSRRKPKPETAPEVEAEAEPQAAEQTPESGAKETEAPAIEVQESEQVVEEPAESTIGSEEAADEAPVAEETEDKPKPKRSRRSRSKKGKPEPVEAEEAADDAPEAEPPAKKPRPQRTTRQERIREENELAAQLKKRLDGLTDEDRQRIDRFVPLAKRMAGDGESWELLAMLLDQAGSGEEAAAPRKSGRSRPRKAEPAPPPLTPAAPLFEDQPEDDPIMQPKRRRPRRRRRRR